MKYLDNLIKNTMIVAVDFDNTLCESAFPTIGKANDTLIGALIAFRAIGNKLILWTCREGEHLQEAIAWCREWGLEFDAINENVENPYSHFIGSKRKIFAHLYLDDKAMHPEGFLEMLEIIKKNQE